MSVDLIEKEKYGKNYALKNPFQIH